MGNYCSCFSGVTRVVTNTEAAIGETTSSVGGEVAHLSTPGDKTPLALAGIYDSHIRSAVVTRNWTAFEEINESDPTASSSGQ